MDEVSPPDSRESKKKLSPKTIVSLIMDILLCRGDMEPKETLDAEPISVRELFRFASPRDVCYFAIGTGCALLGGAIQPFVLILGGWITTVYLSPEQKVGNDQFWNDVMLYVTCLGIAGTGAFVTSFLQSLFLHRGCLNVVDTIRNEYLSAVLRQDAAWFDVNPSGVITAQLNDSIARIQDGMGDKLGLLVRGFSMFFSSAIVCCLISWQVTLISLTIGPISAMTLAMLGKVNAVSISKAMKSLTVAATICEESVMNVRTVQSCNGQEQMTKRYSEALRHALSHSVRGHFWMGFFEGLSSFQIYVIVGLALWFGCYGFYHGLVAHRGDVLLCVNTISLTAYYLGMLGPHMMALLKARVSAAIIYHTIDQTTANDSKSRDLEKEIVAGHVVFDNVHFTYPTRDKAVLDGLSWEARAGEKIALVGPSGCGKSTSIALLTQLYQANNGRITIDGVDLHEMDVSALRKRVGIVQQEPQLFNGTIKENISLNREDVDDARIKRASETANATKFIEKLQNGFDTFIGPGGVTLSGGQKQRIAIARAIVTDPCILFLDEATSALDASNEKIVQTALEQAAKGRTTITIAHRLGAIKNVGKIFVIEQGKVVEAGSHSELLARNGTYAKLIRTQEFDDVIDDSGTSEKANDLPTEHRYNRSSVIFKKSEVATHPSMRSLATGCISSNYPTYPTNSKISSGLLMTYRSLEGSYLLALCSLIVAFVRALELPGLGLAYLCAFKALQMSEDTYWVYAIYAFLVSLGCGLLIWLSQCLSFFFSGWLGERVMDNLKIRVLRSLLHRPMCYFDSKETSPASCVASILQHSPNAMAALDYRFMTNLSNMFSSVIGICIAFSFSWHLGILGTALSSALLILALLNIRISYKCHEKMDREDSSAELAVEIVERARTIQLAAIEKGYLEKYHQQRLKSVLYDRHIGLVDSINFAITQSFVFFCDLSCYVLGTYLIYNGLYDTERVFFAFLGAQFSGWSIMYSAPYFPDLIKADGSARVLFEMVGEQSAKSYESGAQPAISGNVKLADVKFFYPARPDLNVINGLSLAAEHGESIALVGPSGCGKSTVVSLLQRFYEAQQGSVCIDDKKIDDINMCYLRSRVTLVGQEPVLFKGSILDNVMLGVDGCSREDAVAACHMANANKFIELLPEAYDTDVGEEGHLLSGGQKQRIAIARALVRKPQILLLDEATSALDTQNEQIVQQALNDAKVDRTTIIIAHRLNSVQHCDRIFYIENGKVVESGTHTSLLQVNGKYARLVRTQDMS